MAVTTGREVATGTLWISKSETEKVRKRHCISPRGTNTPKQQQNIAHNITMLLFLGSCACLRKMWYA